jgi:hypothetical protein
MSSHKFDAAAKDRLGGGHGGLERGNDLVHRHRIVALAPAVVVRRKCKY